MMNVQGEHSKIQVRVVGFVLNTYFNTFPPRKKHQKAQKYPGFLKKDQNMQSKVTTTANLTVTPRPLQPYEPQAQDKSAP